MEKNTKIGVAIVVIIAVLIAYFAGQKSSNVMQPTSAPQAISATAPVTTPYSTQTQPNVYQNPESENANGISCKTFAYKAVSAEQLRTNRLTTVLQSHYSRTLGQCYYEEFMSIHLSGPDSGYIDTTIRSAPDDDWIAECSSGVLSSPQLFCTQHHVGVITEQQFKQLEAQYLLN